METPPDLTTAIVDAATGPASATVDGQSVTARSAADLIALDRYLHAKAAQQSRRKGATFGKFIAPGPLPDDGGGVIGVPFGGGILG